MKFRIIPEETILKILSDKFINRFWSHVKIGSEGECWPWTGCVDGGGYGLVMVSPISMKAHRISWIIQNKSNAPFGLYILHRCKINRRCCNPNHLYAGTPKQNCDDRDSQNMLVIPDNRGQKHGMAILKDADIPEIRKLYATGNYSHQEIATLFGLKCSEPIRRIIIGTGWKHIH